MKISVLLLSSLLNVALTDVTNLGEEKCDEREGSRSWLEKPLYLTANGQFIVDFEMGNCPRNVRAVLQSNFFDTVINELSLPRTCSCSGWDELTSGHNTTFVNYLLEPIIVSGQWRRDYLNLSPKLAHPQLYYFNSAKSTGDAGSNVLGFSMPFQAIKDHQEYPGNFDGTFLDVYQTHGSLKSNTVCLSMPMHSDCGKFTIGGGPNYKRSLSIKIPAYIKDVVVSEGWSVKVLGLSGATVGFVPFNRTAVTSTDVFDTATPFIVGPQSYIKNFVDQLKVPYQAQARGNLILYTLACSTMIEPMSITFAPKDFDATVDTGKVSLNIHVNMMTLTPATNTCALVLAAHKDVQATSWHIGNGLLIGRQTCFTNPKASPTSPDAYYGSISFADL